MHVFWALSLRIYLRDVSISTMIMTTLAGNDRSIDTPSIVTRNREDSSTIKPAFLHIIIVLVLLANKKCELIATAGLTCSRDRVLLIPANAPNIIERDT